VIVVAAAAAAAAGLLVKQLGSSPTLWGSSWGTPWQTQAGTATVSGCIKKTFWKVCCADLL
jgi:hypothetical protein